MRALALLTVAATSLAFAQIKTVDAGELPRCGRGGRRIVSDLGVVAFRVPRFARVRKGADVDYVKYVIPHGPMQQRAWLVIMTGPLSGGRPPEALSAPAIHWEARTWNCPGKVRGTEWIGFAANGRKWRRVTFPFGFASYDDVPAKSAAYFDRILDSVCCGKCEVCK